MNRILIYRKILILMLLCGVFEMRATAQMVNTGEKIFIATGGVISVESDYKHKGGSILDNGKMTIKGNWYNEVSSSSVFIPTSSGSVDFAGGLQKIVGTGTAKTVFPSVNLLGTGTMTLEAHTDISTIGILDIKNRELKTDKFNLSVTNPSPTAILLSAGFISTDNKGKLIRSTNLKSPYLFPLGSSVSPAIYRPVEIEPLDVSANSFAVTLLNKDPNTEAYNRDKKRPDVQTVFDKYFYIINQESGTSNANVRFYQTTAEAEYKQLVTWSSFNLWERAAPSTSTDGTFSGGLTRFLTFTSTKPISNSPFTFATSVSVDNPLTFFNAFSPDGDGKNEKWVINNLDNFPDNTLTVFNRWGDEVFKSKSYSSLKAWDGGNLNPGTYFYVLNVNINGTQKTYKGFINMVKKN